jgi:hypothetical protein
MIHLIFYAAGAVVAGVAALIGASLMKDAQRQVARWLRQHGLAKTQLMDAVVLLDQVGSIIRSSVRVKVAQRPAETLRIERAYSISDIKDTSLLAALRERQHAEVDIMPLFA